MINRFFKLLVLFAMAAACSSKPTTVATKDEVPSAKLLQTQPQASMLAKEVAAEQDAPYVAEISFAKGSTHLNAGAKQKLRRLFQSVESTKQVKTVRVVTWADQDYPSKQAKRLDSKQIEIVNNRNDEIKRFLQSEHQDIPLDLHSMAERPGAMKDLLGTADSRIKKSFESAGIPTTDLAQKTPSKASKAIVMLVLKKTSK